MIRSQLIHPPPEVRELFEAGVLGVIPPEGRLFVQDAFGVATCSHHGQTRDEGTPYIEHPVRVAALLVETRHRDPEVVAAALLHDVIEDCAVTEADLADRFSPRVGRLVQQVSKRLVHPGRPPTVDFRSMSSEAKAIKLADRLDNLRSMHRSPHRWKRHGMLEETYWRYLPVAREIGGPLGEVFLRWWDDNQGEYP